MAKRYIDADKIEFHFLPLAVIAPDMYATRSEINAIPTADVAEVKHGKWVLKNGYITCSECGCEPYALARRIDFDNLHHYCPACGAKMDGGDVG